MDFTSLKTYSRKWPMLSMAFSCVSPVTPNLGEPSPYPTISLCSAMISTTILLVDVFLLREWANSLKIWIDTLCTLTLAILTRSLPLHPFPYQRYRVMCLCTSIRLPTLTNCFSFFVRGSSVSSIHGKSEFCMLYYI